MVSFKIKWLLYTLKVFSIAAQGKALSLVKSTKALYDISMKRRIAGEEATDMKKLAALILSLTFVLTLIGCNNRSMDYIIENEPKVVGIVEKVYDDHVIMYSETAEGYPKGSRWSVPLKAENPDSYTDIAVGDEIVVYYDGSAMETDPLQISVVYAITLKTPGE